MEPEWIIRVVLFSIVHWVLAGILLHDLVYRQRVFGGHKAPWVIIILVIPCVGSLVYLLFHPQVLYPTQSRDEDDRDKRGK